MRKIFFKTINSVMALMIALVPLWLFIGMRGVLSPKGFFQEFFVFGIGIYFLGVWQLIFLITWIILMYTYWASLCCEKN